jgi:DNA-directed RNA polymerase specialized sigma24 family protein
MKLEDLIPDLKIPPPDKIKETRELRRCANIALGGLPEEWRNVLWLRYGDGLTGAKLARAARKSEADVERILEHALHYVRRRLVELGCKFEAEDGPARAASSDLGAEARAAERRESGK